MGANEEPVNTAAARLARDAVRAVLHREGWTLLHASAIVSAGRAVLTFGSKGAGKPTTALPARCDRRNVTTSVTSLGVPRRLNGKSCSTSRSTRCGFRSRMEAHPPPGNRIELA